jgi:predicted nucleotidyltransferase
MDTIIREAMECLAGAVPEGSRVILFGSRARGDAREDSDLDLLVIEPKVAGRMSETIRLTTLLGRKLIPADVVVMSHRAFESQRDVPNTTAYRAAREGIEYEFAG